MIIYLYPQVVFLFFLLNPMQCLLLWVNTEWEAACICSQDAILHRELIWRQSLGNPSGNRMGQRLGWDEWMNSMAEKHISFVSKIMLLIEHTIRHTRKHIVYVTVRTVSKLRLTHCLSHL